MDSSRVIRFVSFLEKKRFNILTLFIWVFIISTIRIVVEWILLNYPLREQEIAWKYQFMHILGFFYAVFLGGVLIVRLFSGEKLTKVANMIGLGFIILLLPPLVDHFIFGRTTPYSYVPVEEFLTALSTFGLSLYPKIGGLGLLLELLALTSLSSSYVFIKTYIRNKSFIKSLIKASLNFAVFYIFISLVGTPTINPIFYAIVVMGEHYFAHLCIPLIFLYNLVLSIFFLLALMKLSKKGLVTSFIRSSRPLTSLHALLMISVGVMVAGHLELGLESRWAGNIGTFGTSLFLILFLWQFAVMINHLYDIKIDRIGNKQRILPKGMLTPDQVKKIATIYAIVSLGLASLLGHIAISITIICLVLAVMYSVPPIRLRNTVFSTFIIGLGSALAFFLGYFTPSYEKVKVLNPHTQIYEYRFSSVFPELNAEGIGIALLIVIVLSIGSLIKDLKDYEGDKKSGVKNIFTVYGKEKGISIASALLPISFFAPLMLFHNLYDLIVFFPFGIMAGISFKKFQSIPFIFLLYFITLFYCIVRWFGII